MKRRWEGKRNTGSTWHRRHGGDGCPAGVAVDPSDVGSSVVMRGSSDEATWRVLNLRSPEHGEQAGHGGWHCKRQRPLPGDAGAGKGREGRGCWSRDGCVLVEVRTEVAEAWLGCVGKCHCPEDRCHVLRNARKERRVEESDQEICGRDGVSGGFLSSAKEAADGGGGHLGAWPACRSQRLQGG